MQDEITVMIACFNAGSTIERAVRSALDQTAPVRVIAVDDCSSDGSFERLQAMAGADPRLTALRQEVNRGPSAARNRALALAATDWVATLDADDYMLPGRLEGLVEIARRAQLDFVADDLIRTLPGQSPGDGFRHWTDERIGVMPLNLARFVRENISGNTGQRREIGYLKPLMRTQFLRMNALAFREDMRLAEDYELYARSLALGARWAVTDPAGYIAVSQEGSLSRSYPTCAIGQVSAADRALLSLTGLSRDDRQALREHLRHTEIDFAWRLMIDAVRARDPALAARALLRPLPVMGHVLVRSVRHLAGLPVIRQADPVARRPARQTCDLDLV